MASACDPISSGLYAYQSILEVGVRVGSRQGGEGEKGAGVGSQRVGDLLLPRPTASR